MKKIIIDPHYCSREEYEELTEYLTSKSWDFKILDERAEMLDSLGFYAVNNSDELPDILDKLLDYKGDGNIRATDVVEELELWQNVEHWNYNDLMGAIS